MTISRPKTWLVVTPYLRQCGPPALVPTLPPIEDTIWLEGSGAKNHPRSLTALVNHRLINPGCTVAHRLARSMSRIEVIRVIDTITPPRDAIAPPINPVPDPRGTMGTRSRRHARTIACTSAAEVGSATASGMPV